MRDLRLAAAAALAALCSVGSARAAEDRTVRWSSAYAPDDRRVVRIGLFIRPSDMPRRVVLRESGSRIRITLLTPTSDLPSTADAVTYCVEVRLRRRVGDRRLFDREKARRRSGPGTGPAALSGPHPCQRLREASG